MLIALLSCKKDKLNKRCSVEEMFSYNKEFKVAYSYASHVADKIYILSAKYGLLETDDIIDPVIENMAIKPPYEKRLWTANVIDKLSRQCSPEEDEFIIIAEREYFEYLAGELRKTVYPLKGIPEDKKYSELMRLELEEREYVSSENVHRLLQDAPEYTGDQIDQIPFSNGVYIMFEKNEEYKGFKRITRVGTHRGDGNLKSRLETHFIKENKNWSIFRKNIGRAILNKENDSYLKIWDMSTGTPDEQIRYADLIDEVKEKETEQRVSMFLKHQITFACIEVESWFDRLQLEEGLIATLNRDPEFGPSKDWFGRYSTEYEIRNSGLWLKRGLDKPPLKRNNIDFIKKAVQKRQHITENKVAVSLELKVINLIKHKKESAMGLQLRYLDLFSEDVSKEIDSHCTDYEIIDAMKKCMNKSDEVLLSSSGNSGSSAKIRFFL